MSIIPCEQNERLRVLVEEYSEVLKVRAHELGAQGLSENEFYNSGLFRGAVERIRGQYAAATGEKNKFVHAVLNHMQDGGFIADWESAAGANRHDYSVTLNSGKTAVIELKGCLDGNNINIFERPPNAHEFVIWSLCANASADPRRNAWSGITRLNTDVIDRKQQVDGVIIWDMVCGTVGRPCPKLIADPGRATELGSFLLPPPCIYLMPATVPSIRNNPSPKAQAINDVEILKAFHDCYGGRDDELNFVDIEVRQHRGEIARTTTVRRAGAVAKKSDRPTPIRRS